MIDSHAHLAEEAYDDDRAEVLARAAAAGVDTVLIIGYDALSCERVIDVVRAGSEDVSMYATAGVAPHHVLETGRIKSLSAGAHKCDEVGDIVLDALGGKVTS